MSTEAPRKLHPWRQGSLVEPGLALEKGWVNSDETDALLFVATHDCDLQTAAEGAQFVELIKCIKLTTGRTSGKHVSGQHARILHIEQEIDSALLALSLDQTQKIVVKKEDLLDHAPKHILSDQNLRTFSRWLASRYSRSALPDSFEQRLKAAHTISPDKTDNKHADKVKKDRRLSNALLSVITELGNPIEGIYLTLEGKESIELKPEEPYSLGIAVVSHSKKGQSAQQQIGEATKLADKIKALFELSSWDKSVGSVIIKSCVPTTERDFSLYHAKRTLRWNYDYLSVNDDE
ncbi:hypothetical protein DWU98_10215 [Dyella monticola]|uniref:Uncharacterized protein n=1 Tax=Dyella monticola TaxID=1927958 RepID=A0A370WZR5_9GAMM|nr:hypothetical protein [Dyella monticola]RDS81596.1 hypothetical protein DWU98_10215 [Dyella monticola]